MGEFDMWHDYRRAVDLGIVDPVRCSHDGWPVDIIADADYSPILHCNFCGTNIIPGLLIKNKVRSDLERATLD